MSEVCITGCGVLSAAGDDPGALWQRALAGEAEAADRERFAPFAHFPFPAYDRASEVPRKQARYMGASMQAATFAAGRALGQAGLKGDAARLPDVDLLMAACEGERDERLDQEIFAAEAAAEDPALARSLKLSKSLRPSLFLAQLPNLYAANISIVHEVTGSSVTFIGEESAGFNAVRTGVKRIRRGRGRLVLAGGACTAEKLDTALGFGAAGLLSGDDAVALGSAAGVCAAGGRGARPRPRRRAARPGPRGGAAQRGPRGGRRSGPRPGRAAGGRPRGGRAGDGALGHGAALAGGAGARLLGGQPARGLDVAQPRAAHRGAAGGEPAAGAGRGVGGPGRVGARRPGPGDRPGRRVR